MEKTKEVPRKPCGIIDSHAHVVSEFFGEDREAVIKRSFDNGVVQMVNPGVVLDNVDELKDIAERHANLFFATGLHPHEAKDWTDKCAEAIEEASAHPKAVGVGECGLDFFYNNSDHDSQRQAFKAQCRLAKRLNKPVIVHCRDAWQEAFDILKEEGAGNHADSLKGVFHCFTGAPEHLSAIAELGFYVSFSGIVTFPNAKALQEAAKLVPEDKILVETDCPFLAPQKVRGAKNEPQYVWYVAEKLAELRGSTVESIAQSAMVNTRKLFSLPEPVL
jgi:TatD DNase family protein